LPFPSFPVTNKQGRGFPYIWLAWLAPAGIFVLGLGLRLYCVDCRGLWYDEIASVEGALRGPAAIFTDRFGWLHTQTPLHYLLVWLTIQPVNPTGTALLVRLPSVLAGALTVPVVYALGKEMFGRAQGLLAALMVALSVIHLNYSQDVRPYAMLTLLTTLSAYCLLIAGRSGSGRWWLAFLAVSSANLLNAYVALTVALPALVAYGAWMLWRLWATRKAHAPDQVYDHGQAGMARWPFRKLLYPALSVVGLACVAMVTLLDMTAVPRTAPNLAALKLQSLLTAPLELVTWFTRFGLGQPLERWTQLALFLLAVWGFYTALRAGRVHGAVLCGLFVLVPPLMLSVLATTNAVFQRYALFVLPFYFLLIGNGLVSPISLARAALTGGGHHQGQIHRTLAQVIGSCLVALPMLCFALGAYTYVDPDRSQSIAVRGDLRMRDASVYLAGNARPDDMIIFMGWDPTVSMFYWQNKPPAPAFSAHDPRIFGHHPARFIYWVIYYESEFTVPPGIWGNSRWQKAAQFGELIIMRQNAYPHSVGDTLDWFTASMQAQYPHNRYVEQAMNTIRGNMYQSQDRIGQASKAYLRAGTLFTMGEEYLRTSQGWAARGEPDRAWRDALIAKSVQPCIPELHAWMAQLLTDMGDAALARTESRIAEALSADLAANK
jgi:hypothetical protein